MIARSRPVPRSLTVAALFAGIGGIELGLKRAGHRCVFACEIDAGAGRVLDRHFPGVPRVADVRAIRELPPVDLVTAGFPCQDLSQAGLTRGIGGARSGLVGEVFRLLGNPRCRPRWVLLENVPFMLQLDKGKAMSFLTKQLEALGYRWAYRVVDARSFGLPQRRQRVLLLASRTEDPRGPLLGQDAGAPEEIAPAPGELAFGFYWTEGSRGLGAAWDAVPTLKAGSTIGIPSPPAIWMPTGEFVTPDIRDAERLQGFPADWTAPAVEGLVRRSAGVRWRLVGNAVSVPLAEWIGKRLGRAHAYDADADAPLGWHEPWPRAAWGEGGRMGVPRVSMWPVRRRSAHLAEFLRHPTRLLSVRATAGFLGRAQNASIRFPDGLLGAMKQHLARVSTVSAAS